MATRKISVRVSEVLSREIEMVAERERRSKASVLAEALELYLQRHPANVERHRTSPGLAE